MSAAAEVVLISNREVASGGVRFSAWLTRGVAVLRQLAPYAAIELLLPGGSLIALVLWLYRHHKKAVAGAGLSASGQADAAAAAVVGVETNSQARTSAQISNTKKCPATGCIFTAA
jgi:hypothetical protein